jgi:LPXTG-motif cell wall-anchored protein
VRKMTVLGASALLVAGLMGSPAAAFAAPIAGAPVAITGGGNDGATCPKDGKVDVEGEHVTLEVTAEPGYLITGYCVKAGSDKQGDGPVDVVVDPPAATVTISHPSGKAISHYTLVTVKAEPTPEPTPSEPSQEPSVAPSGESEGSSGVPSEPAVEPTAGTPGGEGEATTAPSAEEPGELAATGASTAIGFTLIALALVGGGVTLIVLRRKGVLGS